jgi:hypothetical protein
MRAFEKNRSMAGSQANKTPFPPSATLATNDSVSLGKTTVALVPPTIRLITV